MISTTRALAVAATLVLTALHPLAAAAHGNVTRLSPNGLDDTGQLQAALDACSGSPEPCRIELGTGVFHTDVLLVRHFRGRISGKGEGRTIISPLVGVPLRSTDQVFLGGPTLAKPYPILLHFADGGDVTLEDFSMRFPSTMLVQTWSVGPYPVENALVAAVMMDGADTDRARLTLSHVEIVGAKTGVLDSYGSNVINAVRFEGQIRATDPSDDQGTASPLGRGEFTAHDVTTRKTGLGFALRDANRLRVDISDNRISSEFIGMFLTDLGDSRVSVRDNRVASELLAIQWLRGVRPLPDPSQVTIADNELAVNKNGTGLLGPGDGLVFADTTADGGIDRVSFERNQVTLGDAFEAVFVLGDRGHVTVTGNEISGPASDGAIVVVDSRGTLIKRNEFHHIGAAPDVWLQDTTSDCKVIQPGDTVLDEGTGNIVH